MKFLANPWVLLAIVLFFVGSNTTTYFIGRGDGYDKRELEYKNDEDEAEEAASENVETVKQESKIVYKYIREQGNSCDIYDLVIERLRGPQGNRR